MQLSKYCEYLLWKIVVNVWNHYSYEKTKPYVKSSEKKQYASDCYDCMKPGLRPGETCWYCWPNIIVLAEIAKCILSLPRSNCSCSILHLNLFNFFTKIVTNAPARLPNYTEKMAANMATLINKEMSLKLGEHLQQLRRYGSGMIIFPRYHYKSLVSTWVVRLQARVWKHVFLSFPRLSPHSCDDRRCS